MTLSNTFRLAALTALAVVVILLLSAGEVGVTWDEPIYNQAAENAVHWFGTLLRGGPGAAFEQTAFGLGWGLVNEHPPLARLLNALGWVLTRAFLPPPTSHRAGNMFLAACTIGILAAAVARRSGPAAGLFAAAALLAMPRAFFHAHLAALDFPHAATWFLATLVFARVTDRPRRWAPLVLGLALGLALLTKINAVLLLPYWGLWLLLYRRQWSAWRAFLLGLPVALLVLIAGWPWIWKDPVAGLVGWVSFFRVHFDIGQWYAGHYFVKTPWYLPLAIVGITTPVTLLITAALGLFSGGDAEVARSATVDESLCSDGFSRPAGHGATEVATTRGRIFRVDGAWPARARLPEWLGLQVLGFLVICGYYMLPFTAIHDQDRLLLPAMFHLAALAGLGFVALLRWLQHGCACLCRAARVGRMRLLSGAAGALLAALLLLPGVLGIARTHPFELSYYGELIGGAQGARRLDMETIYFASTYGHFLPELNSLPAGSQVWVMPNSYDVLYFYQRNGLLRDDLVLLRPPGWGSFYDDAGVLSELGGLEDADYALIERRQTAFNDATPENAMQLEWAATKHELARVERQGVLLAALYEK